MNRIEKVFRLLKEKEEKAFIPYIMAGDGGLATLGDKITFLEKCGATAVEVGIPFSDPVADGPVIEKAGIRSLKEGTTLKTVLETLKTIRPIVHIPIIIMTYVNPVMAYGIERFTMEASKAGVDGLILPDLPPEEEDLIAPHAERDGLEIIRLATLTSPIERIQQISEKGNGFLYAVTVKGTTGVRRDFSGELQEHLQKVQDVSRLPVLAGFGISTPGHVKAMNQICDGVIVGSKIVQLFEENNLEEIEKLIKASKKENAFQP
ncbi:tryptophan synthase subunit alpha [Bacillus infantis]|uniref:tryptophan synthase subunit alpha n=1 Tax=Bacillus infantis TaxID=324767 RepID=UPI003CED0A7E